MKTQIMAVAALVALAGCQSYPDEPNATFEIAGNYQSVADCSYLKLREEGYWQKDDLDSMATTQLVFGTNTMAIGRIDFVAAGADRTSVSIRFPVPVQGRDHYPNRFRPIIQACSA